MIRKPNFKLNWKYALGELVLIFLGISLAIAFQNWNEERKADQQAIQLLKGLKTDLESDLVQLNRIIELVESRRTYAQQILNYTKKLPTSIDTAEVVKMLERSGWIFSFKPGLSSYNGMINSGNVGLIKSTAFKRRLDFYISRTESNSQIEAFDATAIKAYSFSISRYMEEGLGQTTSMESPDSPASYAHLKIDLKGLSQDMDMIVELRNVVNISSAEIRYKRTLIIPVAEELIKMIDEELSQ